jgi:hypothetical protein
LRELALYRALRFAGYPECARARFVQGAALCSLFESESESEREGELGAAKACENSRFGDAGLLAAQRGGVATYENWAYLGIARRLCGARRRIRQQRGKRVD